MPNTVDVIEVLVKSEVNEAIKGLQKTEKQSDKLTASFKKVGKTLSTTVTPALLALGAVTVKAASDLSESINAVNVTFGEASETIKDFGEQAAESVGLSQNSFNELATVIGAQLKQSGLDISTVADETINLTTRAADLASVFNVDVKEATGALGAALRGESEPARRFGINISDAAVQAEALASGLVKTKDEITDQIKVQARLNLIMQQSNDVAGDFANTSDSLANSSRILKANLENTAAELGQAFLPIAQETLSAVLGIVTGFKELGEGTKTTILVLAGLTAAAGPATVAVTSLGAAFTFLTGPVGLAITALAGIVGATALVVASVEKQLDAEELRKQAIQGTLKTTEAYNRAAEDSRNRIQALEIEIANQNKAIGEGTVLNLQQIQAVKDSIEQKQKQIDLENKVVDLILRNADDRKKSEELARKEIVKTAETEVEAITNTLNVSLAAIEEEKQAELDLSETVAEIYDFRLEEDEAYYENRARAGNLFRKSELDAEKELQQQIRQQNEQTALLISGVFNDALSATAEAFVKGEDAAAAFGKTVLLGIANALDGLSQELAVRSAAAFALGLIPGNQASLGAAAGFAAASALASVGAGVVRGQAAFANGGSFLTGSTQSAGGAIVGDNDGGVERVTVEPISSRNISGAGTTQEFTIKLDASGMWEGLFRASQDGVALIDSRAVV